MNPSENTSHNDNADVVVAARDLFMYFFEGNSVIRALQGVTFNVRQREVFGLIGPAGCGKSTTLRLLAGLITPAEGRIRIWGRRPRRRSVRQRVGYLPQNKPGDEVKGLQKAIGFFKDLFGSRTRNSTGARLEASTSRRLDHRLTKVLLKNPDLLLLDDPFAKLDPADCREMKELIRSLPARGKTVIVCSNSFSDGADICDRIALYSRGRIEIIGTPVELLCSRDAVGPIAASLPSATQDLILNLIRENWRAATLSPASVSRGAADHHDDPQKITPGASAPSTSDHVLQPLLRPAPGLPSSVEVPIPAIDHHKLASLTKPPASE